MHLPLLDGFLLSGLSLSQVYLQPGSAVFSSTWYSGLSGATPAAGCASACCMAEDFSSVVPPGANCPYVPGGATTTTTTTSTTVSKVVVVSRRQARSRRGNTGRARMR